MATEDSEAPEWVSSLIKEYVAYFETEEGSSQRASAKAELRDQGEACYKEGNYSKAVEKFAKHLAVHLLDPHVDHEAQAALYANIGSCLHMLDDLELAKVRSIKRKLSPVASHLHVHAWLIIS